MLGRIVVYHELRGLGVRYRFGVTGPNEVPVIDPDGPADDGAVGAPMG